jgi:hypothetical protein
MPGHWYEPDAVGYLTNETVFDLSETPVSLAGWPPTGCWWRPSRHASHSPDQDHGVSYAGRTGDWSFWAGKVITW